MRSSATRRSPCGAPGTPSIVKIGPTAGDIAGLYEYHLDVPGNALEPGCTYEQWARRVTQGAEPAIYAHVVIGSRRSRQARAAVLVLLHLQRLQQHARGRLGDDPARLRRRRRIGGARRASRLRSAKRTRVPRRRGTTRSSRSSAAPIRSSTRRPLARRQLTDALYLGSSAEAGVGCDDTRGPHRAIAPDVLTIPATQRPPRRRSRGSPSRDGGASCRRPSSTGRPGRT